MTRSAPPTREELFAILETVKDPEVPVLSVVELGIVLVILLGWQFTAATWSGGIVMVAMSV